MAHKHNRRRGRPRSRRNQNRNNSTSSDGSFSSYHSYNSGFSYDSLSFQPQIAPPSSHLQFAIPVRGVEAIREFVPGASHWQGQQPSMPYPRYGLPQRIETPEAKRMRVFGGLPDDDNDLCDKMMEVFEGMAWIKP